MINPRAQPVELPSLMPVTTIQRVVAESYRIGLGNLLSDLREFAWERHVAMYLSRELTGKSLPVIGRCFNRDHTTVLHACRRVEKRMADDPLARADVYALKDALEPVDKWDNSQIPETFRPIYCIEQSVKTQEQKEAA